jgi:hypothetical protein
MAWSTPQNKNLAASLSRAVASSSVPPGEHTPSDGLEQQEDGVCPDGEERDDMDINLEPSPDRSEYHDPANAPEDRLNEQMTLKLMAQMIAVAGRRAIMHARAPLGWKPCKDRSARTRLSTT